MDDRRLLVLVRDAPVLHELETETGETHMNENDEHYVVDDDTGKTEGPFTDNELMQKLHGDPAAQPQRSEQVIAATDEHPAVFKTPSGKLVAGKGAASSEPAAQPQRSDTAPACMMSNAMFPEGAASSEQRNWKIDANGCWIWQGSLSSKGYGKIGNKQAHRVVWELYRSPIPVGLCVLHGCDVKRCVNPDHLHLGTVQDNAIEAVARGLWPKQKGEYNGNARLTKAQVKEIRESSESCRALAIRFGISKSQVGNIKKGIRWTNQ